jgi:5,10-methenyltetrahydromethanopterin hydrogenase
MNGEIVNRHRDKLPKSGKGCIRYSNPEKLDFTVIEQMLRETVANTSGVCE